MAQKDEPDERDGEAEAKSCEAARAPVYFSPDDGSSERGFAKVHARFLRGGCAEGPSVGTLTRYLVPNGGKRTSVMVQQDSAGPAFHR
jgi:hypothetical protein